MRHLLTAAALVTSMFVAPQSAYACSCIGYETDEEYFNASFVGADIVVQATVVSVEEDENRYVKIAQLSTERFWKGQAESHITIETGLNSAACGVGFEEDTTYVIFATERSDGIFHAGSCSATRSFEHANQLLNWLHDYEPVESEGETEEEESEEDSGETGGTGDSGEEEIDGFVDVSEDHPNIDAITFVQERGIVNGYDDGSFGPDNMINRAEFTKIVIGALYSQEEIDTCEAQDLFSDVSQSDWFGDFVCVAKLNNIIGGYPDGSFQPDNYVNFAEAAKIVVSAFEIPTEAEDHLGIWWKPYVFALARINGLPTSFSDPNQQLTRGDMAEIIYRVMKD